MNRSALASLLFTLATCGGSQRASDRTSSLDRATRPLADVQATIDACKSNNDTACHLLCNEVFQPAEGEAIGSCTYAVRGDQVDLEAMIIRGDRGYSSSSSSSSDSYEPGCAGGRRPFGLACPESPASSEIGAFFARAAQLEAASVVAFGRIHQHIERHGADTELLARIRAAIVDELDHARRMIVLARRYGAEPVAPVIAPEPALSPLERAIENAVEGCVGESAAALQAQAIAVSARDPVVRETFARIAADEATHALLSFEIAAVLARDLDGDEPCLVDDARHAAISRALAAPPHPALVALGVSGDHRLPAVLASIA